MIVHNMITRKSMVVDAPMNHEVIADLSPIGLDSGMISYQFICKPWSVDGKPSEVPAYHKPMDFMTKVYNMLNSHFFPVPYVGVTDGNMVLLIACDDDDTSPEAIEVVLEEVKTQLNYYCFFDSVRQELIEALGV